MPIHITVTTVNSSKDGGGFHEIHTIRYLSSVQHAIDSIKSIIMLNKAYCGASELNSVKIETDNAEIIRAVFEARLGDFAGATVFAYPAIM